MDPNDFYRRMMQGVQRTEQQSQAIEMARLRAMQQGILAEQASQSSHQQTKQPVPEKFKDCEIIDAEFEVITNEPEKLEEL